MVSERGSKFGGLSGWVVVGCGVSVVGVVAVGRGGGSDLLIMLACGSFVCVACVVVEGGGGSDMEFSGIGVRDGGGGGGIIVGGCGFGSGESLAEFFPLS